MIVFARLSVDMENAGSNGLGLGPRFRFWEMESRSLLESGELGMSVTFPMSL